MRLPLGPVLRVLQGTHAATAVIHLRTNNALHASAVSFDAGGCLVTRDMRPTKHKEQQLNNSSSHVKPKQVLQLMGPLLR
jgi:hypothetical protein